MRALIAELESRRPAKRASRSAAPSALPGHAISTSHGELHLVEQTLAPNHCHGRVAVADCLSVSAASIAALALDDELNSIDLRTALFLDTETTGLSGGTGTLPFLIGMAFFEDRSLRIEQLVLRRPGEERPMLERLAERLTNASCIVTYNGKAFDWPLLRTRAIMNRIAIPTPRAHLDLLHSARRVVGKRLGSVRLVQMESEVLGFRRERDVDGAEIPHIYWEMVRGGEESSLAPVIEHNANDLVALAAIIVVLAERWEEVLPHHEPEDRLGIARIAWRCGDLARASEWARAAVAGGGSHRVAGDALELATRVARRLNRHTEAGALLLEALTHASDAPTRASLHLALSKHFEHRARDFDQALFHADRSGLAETPELLDKRIRRLHAKRAKHEDRQLVDSTPRAERTRAAPSSPHAAPGSPHAAPGSAHTSPKGDALRADQPGS